MEKYTILLIADTECNETHMTVWVRNGGTGDSTEVELYIDGSPADATIGSIKARDEVRAEIERAGNTRWMEPEYHSIRVEASESSARGSVYCPE